MKTREHRSIPFAFGTACVLEGLMLGDGSLWRGQPGSRRANCNSYYRQSSVSVDWLELLRETFVAAGYPARVSHVRQYTYKNGETSEIYWLQTCASVELTREAKRWYGAKKIVPADVLLSRPAVLHWYLGDGTLKHGKDPTLCVLGFAHNEILRLKYLLAQAIEVDDDSLSLHKHRTSYNIHIKQAAVAAFFDYIGPSPVSSLAYKWPIHKE